MLICLNPTDVAKKYDNLLGPVNLLLTLVAERESLTDQQVTCIRGSIVSADLAKILEAEEAGDEWADLQVSISQCVREESTNTEAPNPEEMLPPIPLPAETSPATGQGSASG